MRISDWGSDVCSSDLTNIVYDLHVSFIDAALGASIEVPIVDGKARIKIDPGTHSGKILRLKGKGIPAVNAYGKGDQLVYVSIWTPRQPSDDEREVLDKLKASDNFARNPAKKEKQLF